MGAKKSRAASRRGKRATPAPSATPRPPRRRRRQPALRPLLRNLDAIVWQARVLQSSEGGPPQIRYTFVSRGAEELIGLPARRWLRGNDFWERHVHPQDRKRVVAAYHAALAAGSAHRVEYRVLTADGRQIWLRDRVRVERDGNGRARRLFGLMVETGERKRLEQALRDEVERLSLAVAGADEGVWDWKLEKNELYLAPRWKEILGYEDRELPSRLDTWISRIHPDDRKRFATEIVAHANGKIPHFNNVHRLLHRDGRYCWVAARGLAVRDPTGRPIRIAGSLRDVSATKEAERQLAHAAADARAILRALPDLYFRLDRNGTILDYHAPRPAELHLSPEVFMGRKIQNVFGAEPGRVFSEALRRVLESRQLTHLDYSLPNGGEVRRFEGRMVPVHDGHVVLIARDITDRLRLQEAQEEEAEVSFALARVGREVMAYLNTPELLNRLCQLTAQALDCDFSHTWLWQAEEGVFSPVAGWGDRSEQWESMRVVRVPRTVIARLVAALERNDVVQLSLDRPQDLLPLGLWQQYGITSCLYVALRRGEQLAGILTSGYFGRVGPFTSKQERIGRGVGQLTSLALANARLFEELERANSLKSDFVATMSHELRTPLNVILGYIELLLDGLFGNLTEEQADTVRRIGRNARELLDLINATLDLSRLESGRVSIDLTRVDLADLIQEIEREMQDLHRKPEVSFRWDVDGVTRPIVTDRTKLKVVLKNLISNALKFTSHGEVSVRVQPLDDGVEFAVKDTGIGIATEVQAAIFEPFRQADRSIMGRFGGVGLGLYIVRRLLEMVGGTVSLESEPDKGSTFRVWVPDRGQMPDADSRASGGT